MINKEVNLEDSEYSNFSAGFNSKSPFLWVVSDFSLQLDKEQVGELKDLLDEYLEYMGNKVEAGS